MDDINLACSGIYAIRCRQRVYVGSAKHIAERWRYHKRDLRRGNHHSGLMQRAWDKYGASAFSCIVIEPVAELEHLLAREQHWIDALRACDRDVGFNIAPIAGRSRFGVKLSEETKKRIGAKSKGRRHSVEAKAKISKHFKGRIITSEHRANLSKALTGKKTLTRADCQTARPKNER